MAMNGPPVRIRKQDSIRSTALALCDGDLERNADHAARLGIGDLIRLAEFVELCVVLGVDHRESFTWLLRITNPPLRPLSTGERAFDVENGRDFCRCFDLFDLVFVFPKKRYRLVER